jgi:asparagine synthase (glutamine-hydrolysing)
VPPSPWFAVLPGNTPAARRTAAAALDTDRTARVLAYADGYPWIVGTTALPLTTARVGAATAALIGDHATTSDHLASVLARCTDNAWGPLTCLPGSFWAAVATPAGRWLIGDVAGLRPVFAARLGGHTVLGSHARTLAAMTGTPRADPRRLALHLLGPAAPTALLHPDATHPSTFRTVTALAPAHAAHVGTDGTLHAARYWRPPDDDAALADGVPAFRSALREAVAARSRGGPVAVELSGGLDSTSLSYLVSEQAQLLALTREAADPGNDDAQWARLAIDAQPGARHEHLTLAGTPAQFDGIASPLSLDAPGPTALSPDRSAAMWRRAVAGGARTLLAGKGGDELLCPPLTYLSAAAVRSPRTARAHRRGWAALHGWTPAQMRADAAHPGSYGTWLARCLASPDRPGWEAGPWVPQWLAQRTRRALADDLREAAHAAVPQHPRPHQHTTLAAVRAMAALCRLQADAAGAAGLTMAYPYADRAVIDAALAVRAEDRYSPYAAKPLLTAAMDGIAAPASLRRRTKSGYNADTGRAVARNRPVLLGLLGRESALADHHLVDPASLRRATDGWADADPVTDLLLHLTLAAEVWLRTVESRPVHDPLEASC